MGKPVSGNPSTFSSGAVLLQAGKHDVEVIAGSQFITQTGGKDPQGRPLPARVAWRIRFRTGEGDIPWHYPFGDRKWVAPSPDGRTVAAEDDQGVEFGRFTTTVDDDRDAYSLSKNGSTALLIRSAIELGVPPFSFEGENGLDADCLVGLKGKMHAKVEKREGLKDQNIPLFYSIETVPGGATGSSGPKAAAGGGKGPSDVGPLSDEHRNIGIAAAKFALEGKDDGLPLAKLSTVVFKQLAKQKLAPKERVRIKKVFGTREFVAGLGDEWLIDDEGNVLFAG